MSRTQDALDSASYWLICNTNFVLLNLQMNIFSQILDQGNYSQSYTRGAIKNENSFFFNLDDYTNNRYFSGLVSTILARRPPMLD